MSAAVVVSVLVVLAVAGGALWTRHRRASPPRQVDAFAAARAVTKRWSEDPATTPQPLKDYLREQQQHDKGPPQV